MKVSIIIIAVVVITTQSTYIGSAPYKPKIQIYEIHENPTWKDNSNPKPKTRIIPSTLLPGIDLDNIDKPKILIFPIHKNLNQIPDVFKELIRKNIKDKSEASDTTNSLEVRKMILNKYEGDTSDSDDDNDSERYKDKYKFNSDTSDGADDGDGDDDDIGDDDGDGNTSEDSNKDFVDETRSRSRLRKGKKENLHTAQMSNNVVFFV
ncbi:uncharacterized protein LOC133521705 [Cydia pomonella]|uniref:uncharacterized protein LOC133521705 n=1 Tax=Cydia pomonella TaxID=82600 RepID=UPI002ADD48F2|nr:uncharacterized protein LOC133521705 [Cydia pomonella]